MKNFRFIPFNDLLIAQVMNRQFRPRPSPVYLQ